MARYAVAAALLVLTAVTLVVNGYEKTAEEGTGQSIIFDETEEARHEGAGDAKQGKDGSAESWTGWAKDKIQGLGLKLDDSKQDSVVDQTIDHVKDGVGKAQKIMSETGRSASIKAGEYKDAAAGKTSEAEQTVSNKAGRATEKVKETACDAACKAKQKAAEGASETASEASKKAAGAKDVAMDKATEAKDKAYEGAEYAKLKAEETKDAAVDKAKEGYETAKKKAGETVEGAKDTVYSNYDAANHKTQEMKGKVVDNRIGGGRDEEL
uniref:Late embryogenesis abundant 1 n=1 Tax=Tamarix hispida TaxID=189793 RepID=W8EAK1_9CARY|nr:late embryogenesis abundant protein [Tamarix hispida]AIL24127.1 late embryogenesis abundant 1 [Tamarix hispida]